MTSPLEALQARLAYRFHSVELLERALTHRSFVNESGIRGPTIRDNQRLEFLGDAVLGVVITDYLFARFPTFDEGKLSKMKAQLVCESALAPAAAAIGLGDSLRLGRGEEANGGRLKPSVLADAYEALIASLYLDGGLEAARTFILSHHSAVLEEIADPDQWQNPKTTLQEIVQSERGDRPTYEIVEVGGPPHLRRFTAHVIVGGQRLGMGEGKSKKEAQQNAAIEALATLRSRNNGCAEVAQGQAAGMARG
jgi:ribonuclease III